MENFSRIVCPGNAVVYDNIAKIVVCRISYTDGRLSITGVHGPKRNGDTFGSCGQIRLEALDFNSFDTGWTQERVNMFASIWKRFHLNDMKAGSPAQEFYLQNNPIEDPLNYFDAASEALESAGLNPDPYYTIHNGKPYKYGTTWLSMDVPEWALQWLHDLPQTERDYAWV